MRSTAARSWPLRSAPLILMLLLAGCAHSLPASSPVAPPHIPQPAPELMQPPALTSSALLQRAQDDMTKWSDMLQASPTK
ncbi:hypothetical protein BOBR111200_07070 [Bordetella bronchialis]